MIYFIFQGFQMTLFFLTLGRTLQGVSDAECG